MNSFFNIFSYGSHLDKIDFVVCEQQGTDKPAYLNFYL